MRELPTDPNKIVDAMAEVTKRDGEKIALLVLDKAEAVLELRHDDYNCKYYNLVLTIPFQLYADIRTELTPIQKYLSRVAAAITNMCMDAQVDEVVLNHLFDATSDWRSGDRQVVVTDRDADRIWKPGTFRLFLSHVSIYKKEVSRLKEVLSARHVDAFVAHEDIEPSLIWQHEIELALASCHAIVALITPEFHESVWCMQEVGWGLGRGVLVQAIKIAGDPRGFTASVQALSGSFNNLVILREQLIDVLAKSPQTRGHMHEPLVKSLERAQKSNGVEIILTSLNLTEGVSLDLAKRIYESATTNSCVSSNTELAKKVRDTAMKFGYIAQVRTTPIVRLPIDDDDSDPFAA